MVSIDSMHDKRLFVDQPLEVARTLALTGDAAHYVGRVLRARTGDPLVLFNGDGAEYTATIEHIARREVQVRVAERRASEVESELDFVLMPALSRSAKLDLIIQKATELGVRGIRPLALERSAMQLDPQQAQRKLVHWQAVATSACQQCGRVTPPRLHAPATLTDALAAEAVRLRLIALPGAERGISAALAAAAPQPVALLVGPEGGFNEKEADLARAAGCIAVAAGPRILRTETAAIALAAIVQSTWGDLA